MKNIFMIVFVVGILLYGNANSEICIAGRCTDDSSIGSISVSSVNGSWNCSGPGCAAFEQGPQSQNMLVKPLNQRRLISPAMRNRILIDSRFEGSILREELTGVNSSTMNTCISNPRPKITGNLNNYLKKYCKPETKQQYQDNSRLRITGNLNDYLREMSK